MTIEADCSARTLDLKTTEKFIRLHGRHYWMKGNALFYLQSATLFTAGVSVWRSIEILLGLYVFPDNPLKSALVCLFFGSMLYFVFAEFL